MNVMSLRLYFWFWDQVHMFISSHNDTVQLVDVDTLTSEKKDWLEESRAKFAHDKGYAEGVIDIDSFYRNNKLVGGYRRKAKQWERFLSFGIIGEWVYLGTTDGKKPKGLPFGGA